MKEPTDCGLLGKKNLGDPNCQHQWNWSSEIITTAPAKQHRSCTLCGRRECVSICRSETVLEECKDPNCKGHLLWGPTGEPTPASPVQSGSNLVMKNGILRFEAREANG